MGIVITKAVLMFVFIVTYKAKIIYGMSLAHSSNTRMSLSHRVREVWEH